MVVVRNTDTMDGLIGATVKGNILVCVVGGLTGVILKGVD